MTASVESVALLERGLIASQAGRSKRTLGLVEPKLQKAKQQKRDYLSPTTINGVKVTLK